MTRVGGGARRLCRETRRLGCDCGYGCGCETRRLGCGYGCYCGRSYGCGHGCGYGCGGLAPARQRRGSAIAPAWPVALLKTGGGRGIAV